jgi:hypothetical protein
MRLMQCKGGSRCVTQGDGWWLTFVCPSKPAPAGESPATYLRARQPCAKGSPWVSEPDAHLPTTCQGGNKIPGAQTPKAQG